MLLVTTCPVNPRHLHKLKEDFPQLDIRVHPSLEEALIDLPNCNILLTYGEDLTPEVINHCNRLAWIHVISAGLDRVPFKEIKSRGILMTNAKGIHKGPMAEHTLGIMLMFSRRLMDFYNQQRSQIWDRALRLEELSGKTLGIIGAGSIGAEIGKKSKAFGMKTIGMVSNPRQIEGLDEIIDLTHFDYLLKMSDYIVVSVPLTASTINLIGKEELALMRTNAVLINISRGKVVDEEALIEVLKNRRIRGAALDAFVEEPLPIEHPFWKLDNCFITPHISSRSPLYMERALDIFRDNLESFLKGKTKNMINLIDLEKGY